MSGLARARLYKVGPNNQDDKISGKVQFNPETLKVSYSNQLAAKDDKQTAGQQSDGTSAAQFVGKGSTKLSLQLWFDITAPMPDNLPIENDVRMLTKKVTELMKTEEDKNKGTFSTPKVCFEWGSFKFTGIIESLEESLEFFSENGVPLRASMSLSMSQQDILVAESGGPGFSRPTPGANALTQATAGSSLQGLAAASGLGKDWQSIAAANGIENPRLLPPGQFIDLAASTSVGIGL